MNIKGFGLLSLLITIAIMAFLIIKNANFLGESSSEGQKSIIEIGQDAIEDAEEVKNTIEERSKIR